MGNGSSKTITLPDMKLKMVLIGSGGSGKTSVFSRITSNQFNYHYTQTTSVKIGTIVKKINVPVECLISLALWDLPGLEDMDMRKSYYENIDGAVLVVNINDTESISEAVQLKEALLELTKTSSELATFETVETMPNEVGVDSKIANTQDEAEKQTDDLEQNNLLTEQSTEFTHENIEQKKDASPPEEYVTKESCSPPIPVTKLKEIPTLLLGSKVDDLQIEEDQEELHPNVQHLSDICKEANCTGWVPVSAKQNDRSIDFAFTSFLRYLVEKKLNLEQIAGKIRGLEKIKTMNTVPTFLPPSTAATRIRDRFQLPTEDENAKRLPLIEYDPVDAEYTIIRRLVGKVRRGHKDWRLAYRRFRKSAYDYHIAPSTNCSIEELILNIKERLPGEHALKVVEFQGWIKLELDDEVVDIDELDDDVLEVVDCFNYELFPNAAYVASTVKNAMISISDCTERLTELQVPVSCSDQVKLNKQEISRLLQMCESSTTEVNTLRKAIEVAALW
ncbi:uncharacterized protein LOC134819893 isoform X2 [Bolinopsis microptera]|uniref:uncharacterized protein LOC134819893 isoform X2 n=1 Tax=Bolinopsis microptera TaxID=2820187 RepID=UPI0030796F9A